MYIRGVTLVRSCLSPQNPSKSSMLDDACAGVTKMPYKCYSQLKLSKTFAPNSKQIVLASVPLEQQTSLNGIATPTKNTSTRALERPAIHEVGDRAVVRTRSVPRVGQSADAVCTGPKTDENNGRTQLKMNLWLWGTFNDCTSDSKGRHLCGHVIMMHHNDSHT